MEELDLPCFRFDGVKKAIKRFQLVDKVLDEIPSPIKPFAELGAQIVYRSTK